MDFLLTLKEKIFFTLIMVIVFISKDMERQTEGLGSGQKKLPHSSASHPEDSSDSADETKHVSYALFMLVNTLLDCNAHIVLFITHTWVTFVSIIVSATLSASWDFFLYSSRLV